MSQAIKKWFSFYEDPFVSGWTKLVSDCSNVIHNKIIQLTATNPKMAIQQAINRIIQHSTLHAQLLQWVTVRFTQFYIMHQVCPPLQPLLNYPISFDNVLSDELLYFQQ